MERSELSTFGRRETNGNEITGEAAKIDVVLRLSKQLLFFPPDLNSLDQTF